MNPDMACIPNDQLDLLKQEVSLQRLAEGVKVVLKRHGRDLIRLGSVPSTDSSQGRSTGWTGFRRGGGGALFECKVIDRIANGLFGMSGV